MTGTEGGITTSSSYSVSAGGSITMYLYQSSDIIIIGSNQLSTAVTVNGQISGSYPTSTDLNGDYIAQGVVALDRITISPASGYTISDLIVDGASKGALTAFDFVGTGPFTFSVTFAQEVVQTPPPEAPVTTISDPPATTPDPPATTPDPPVTTPTKTVKTVAPVAPVVEETPVAQPVVEATPVETPTVAPVVATDTVTATPIKASTFPLWLLLLLIFLFLIILFLLFLFWKKRKKKEEETSITKK